MTTPELSRGLEALLFLAEEPLAEDRLAELLDASIEEVRFGLQQLVAEYTGRGITIREVGGGWRMYTSPAVARVVERFLSDGRRPRLSRAALETLAIIAYRQPIGRQAIADIRGVNPDGPLRTLLERGLIEEVDRAGPGQAVRYGTTTLFLERLGLRSLDELPPLPDFLPERAFDEPGPEHHGEARRRLAAGEELPATGRPRWDPSAAQQELEQLGRALDEVARAASAQVRRALAAVEGASPEAPEEGPEGR